MPLFASGVKWQQRRKFSKLVNSSATSSKSELTYEMPLKVQSPSSLKRGSSGVDDADCKLGCGENSTDSPVG
ncbi:hypothetical protein P5673_014936 [Acropora cervicornis]|uniref:Uncharacterized protein n=1 Tax=Acropora cervicornis TaxID=6130 RepID=A0AAD9QIV9_ACRCE|nr:hypothetical protein P5673_014936 [Acropora cervicornis]